MINPTFNFAAGLGSFSPFVFLVLAFSAMPPSSTAALHPTARGQPGTAPHRLWGRAVRMKGELSSRLPPALLHGEEGFRVWFRSPTVQAACGVHAKPQMRSLEIWMARRVCVCSSLGVCDNCHVWLIFHFYDSWCQQRLLHERWQGTNTEGACSPNKYVHEQLNDFIYNRHLHFLVCKRLICTYHRALL